MPTSTRTFFIGLGSPTTTSSSLVLYDSGQAGELGAQRILTHPDATNFAPINYYRNPDRVFNLDTEVIPSVRAEAVDTLSARQIVRFDETLADVVVTEIWEGSERRRASMPTFLFRQFYEYLRNPPAYDPLNPTYIQWAPRDRTTKVYNVQVFRLKVGGGSRTQIFDIDDFRLPDTELAHPLLSMDVSPTGLITRNVELWMRVVSEAA